MMWNIEQFDVVGDGVCDSGPCHAAIATRGATPSIPPREGTAHRPANTLGLRVTQ
ncbi:hypothetical protein J3L14_20790 [Burkholderia pseudomallei]|uniref:Uncharacterized protein n=1 Tax=Burkholderia pseudomallei TaxID=28450 RepID=A0A8A4FMN3_BURPE|nr:transposase IS4 family protein [Burkholderia pseudomallei MSHR543]QTB82955.1 hypothetical protein J3L14_20790 [Burkholderia pseudomallei]QWV56876.1 hypothetical protein J2A69_011145 [Burkholderia pseudomallei]